MHYLGSHSRSVHEQKLICPIKEDIFSVAYLHHGCFEIDILVWIEWEYCILVCWVVHYIFVSLEFLNHIFTDNPPRIVLKLDLNILIAFPNYFNLCSQSISNKTVVLRHNVKRHADFEIVLDDGEFVYGVAGVFLDRVLYGRIDLFERIVNLKTKHHVAATNLSIVIDVWHQSMQMCFILVQLAVFI